MHDPLRSEAVTSGLLAGLPSVAHGFGLRAQGSSREDLRARVNEALAGVGAAYFLTQVHGTRVARAPWQEPPRADAGLTETPGCLLCVETADCLPILLVDQDRRLAAAVHAGWRGTAAGIVGAVVDRMIEAGARPPRVLAALGPCIGPCCYEVGDDVLAAFATMGTRCWHEGPNGRPHLDLRAANRWQLESCGLRPDQIEDLAECTFCHPRGYPSYRRDGADCGRMVSFVGWREESL
jgi:YfiH family protein